MMKYPTCNSINVTKAGSHFQATEMWHIKFHNQIYTVVYDR